MKPRANLTTQRFGRLVVIAPTNIQNKRREYKWECLCDCGKTTYVLGSNLKHGSIVSCGCKRRNAKTDHLQTWVKSQRYDHAGQQFGHLIVIKPAAIQGTNGRKWICQCDCGNIKEVLGAHLRKGHTRSCGCLFKEARPHRVRVPDSRTAARSLISRYKQGARQRKYEWGLSNEEFAALIRSNCFYCGTAPSRLHRVILYNGIDRLDNKKGYTTTNAVPSCSTCNFAKYTMSLEEFKNWIERVYIHMFNQQPDSTCELKPALNN